MNPTYPTRTLIPCSWGVTALLILSVCTTPPIAAQTLIQRVLTYDSYGNPLEIQDANGMITSVVYNGDGTQPVGLFTNARQNQVKVITMEGSNPTSYGPLPSGLASYKNGNGALTYSIGNEQQVPHLKVQITGLTSRGGGVSLYMGTQPPGTRLRVDVEYKVTQGVFTIHGLNPSNGVWTNWHTSGVSSGWESASFDIVAATNGGLFFRPPWNGDQSPNTTFYLRHIRVYPAEAQAQTGNLHTVFDTPVYQMDPGGTSVSHTYDTFGRLTSSFNDAGERLSDHTYFYSLNAHSTYNPAQPNYVQTRAYGGGATRTQRAYFDGLGRPIQTVTSSEGEAMITATDYDGAGRAWRTWKPVPRPGTGVSYDTGYQARAVTEYKTDQNQAGGAYPYSEARYEPSPLNRPSQTISPGGLSHSGSTDIAYSVENVRGHPYQVTTSTDPEGKITKTYTDGWGRTVRTIGDPGGVHAITDFIYDELDRLLEVRPPNYHAPPSGSVASDWVITYHYDTIGNLIRTTSPDAGTVRYAYDRAQRLRFSQDANQAEAGELSFTRYDKLGRVIRSGVARDAGTFTALNPNVTHPFETDNETRDGNVHGVYQYDTTPDPQDWPWSHFPASVFTTFSEGASHGKIVAEAWRFAGTDLPSSVTIDQTLYGADESVTAAEHIEAGNSVVEAGSRVTYKAGKSIRLKPGFRTEPGATFTARIDTTLVNGPAGVPSSNPWQLTLFTYDGEGRVRTKRILTGDRREWDATITYTYNRLGEPTRRKVDVAGQTLYHHYTYNKRGQLAKVYLSQNGTRPAQPQITYTYTPDGQLEQASYKGGTGMDYEYDIRGWLKTINNPGVASLPFSARYIFLKNGNIHTTEYRNPLTSLGSAHQRYAYTHTYDGLNRLTSATYFNYAGSWQSTQAFDVGSLVYDKQGNIRSLRRRKETGSLIDNLTFSYSASNRLSAVNDGVATTPEPWDAEDATFTYDASGNMTAQTGKFSRLHYDHRNRPTLTELTGGGRLTARYNSAGLRILKAFTSPNGETSWNYYLRDGDQTLAILDQDGKISHNLLGRGIEGQWVNGEGSRYFLKDHLGSTRAIVDQNGNHLSSYDYYPFGAQMAGRSSNTSNENDTYKFTGHEHDDEAGMNLYNANARGYDPVLGRFMQVDPLADGYPGWSSYNYTLNNPLLYTDPTGGCPQHMLSQCIQFGKGLGIGAWGAVKGTFAGLWQTVRHPIQTGKAVYGAFVNYDETYEAIKTGVRGRVDMATSGDASQVGEVVGEASVMVGELLVGSKGLGKLGKGTKVLTKVDEVADIAKGISVIGPRATYREFAQKIGAQFLNVTDDAWTWSKNEKFLSGIVNRGDDVVFAGKFNPNLLDKTSVLAREIKYLESHGYQWTDDFSKMIIKEK